MKREGGGRRIGEKDLNGTRELGGVSREREREKNSSKKEKEMLPVGRLTDQ